jgi:alanine racemase
LFVLFPSCVAETNSGGKLKKIRVDSEIESHFAFSNYPVMKFGLVRSVPNVIDIWLSNPEEEIGQLFFDSRLVLENGDGTFFCFRSERADGHRFIPDLIQIGVRKWVVSDPVWFRDLAGMSGHSVALAENPLSVMAGLASLHRRRFAIPVLAITGSNGKTIVKEWLGQLLESRFSICKSPKSFNSQIGVPLSVWNLHEGHTLGLFEAGVSMSGEMEVLEQIIQPDLGIFTNLGPAHFEGFSSEYQKFSEKLSLFRNARQLVMPNELFLQWEAQIREQLPRTEILTWSWEKEDQTTFRMHFNGMNFGFFLPFQDQASLENLGNSISAALLLGMSPEEIAKTLSALNQPEMRLSLKAAKGGNVLLDDSYTNEPNGLDAALQFANLQRKAGQKLVLILSDLEGFSGNPGSLYELIGSRIQAHQVSQLITIGNQFQKAQFSLPQGHLNFPDRETLLKKMQIQDFNSCMILIKGSRRFGLEKLVKQWQEKVDGTCLEINLDALIHNLNFYRSVLPTGTRMMVMVKALGYGSGDAEIARLLEFHRVDYLAVAYADEGIKLREAGISMPIMVMNPTPDAMEQIFRFRLEPEIYSFRVLQLFEEVRESGKFPEIPSIHIKVDTGMHRLGFLPEDVDKLATALAGSGIRVASVFSHLAAADEDSHSEYTLLQLQGFSEFCTELKARGITGFSRHMLNSAGILRYPEAAFEMVRLGIGLYGIEAGGAHQHKLRPVSRLKTIISQIKEVPAGSSVGYGRREYLSRKSRVATLAIGYSDGFRRAFSAGAVRIKYQKHFLPVLGNVCMDMCMIDVTDTSLEEGDEITIFETAEEVIMLAKAAETIPYEILTGIGHRVKRIFYRE